MECIQTLAKTRQGSFSIQSLTYCVLNGILYGIFLFLISWQAWNHSRHRSVFTGYGARVGETVDDNERAVIQGIDGPAYS